MCEAISSQKGRGSLVISHMCRLICWLILEPRPPNGRLPCTFFIKPFLALPMRSLTVPSFTALAVLFPDCQKLTYVKQQDVALLLCTMK